MISDYLAVFADYHHYYCWTTLNLKIELEHATRSTVYATNMNDTWNHAAFCVFSLSRKNPADLHLRRDPISGDHKQYSHFIQKM